MRRREAPPHITWFAQVEEHKQKVAVVGDQDFEQSVSFLAIL